MDSEDEKFLERLEKKAEDSAFRALLLIPGEHRIPLKSWQKEEWKALKRALDELMQYPNNEINWRNNYSAVYRLQRLRDSIQGFYSGNLDLTGRHPYRYQDLWRQCHRFITDVSHLYSHCRVEEVPHTPLHLMLQKRLGREIRPTSTVYHIEPVDIRERFERVWRCGALDLGYIFEMTAELSNCLPKDPKPIFQKLLLQDLPPELIHEIMKMTSHNGARRLGSTSKYLRQIATPYMYKCRELDVPPSLKLDPAWHKLSRDQKMDDLMARAKRSCSVILDELDFVLSRPDIMNYMSSLEMFGDNYLHVQEMLDFEIGDQDYLEMFGPIESRIGLLLKQVPNLTKIHMANLILSEDMMQSLMSLNALETIRIYQAYIIDDYELSQCSSVVNLYISFIGSDEINLSLWRILKPCIDLQYLSIYRGSEMNELDPGPMFCDSFNPFSPLKRLEVSGVQEGDILFLCRWMQGASSLNLTHLCLKTSEGGISPDTMDIILDTLKSAPLKILVLDGLHGVPPSLFDDIANAFPGLRGLTVEYRENPQQDCSQPEIWPYPSYEYASHLGGFHRLEFFGWNFKVNRREPSFHRTLCAFESGFRPDQEGDAQVEESLADWESIARVLAAYCKTLTHVVFDPGQGPECTISRSSGGRIVVAGSAHVSPELEIFYPTICYSWEI